MGITTLKRTAGIMKDIGGGALISAAIIFLNPNMRKEALSMGSAACLACLGVSLILISFFIGRVRR